MPSLPARRLIVLYAVLEVLSNLVTALPGGPSFGPGFAFWMAVEALLIWRLWHASVFAWFLLLVSTLFALPLFVLMAPEYDTASILISLLALAGVLTLLTPSMLKFVWSRGKTAVA